MASTRRTTDQRAQPSSHRILTTVRVTRLGRSSRGKCPIGFELQDSQTSSCYLCRGVRARGFLGILNFDMFLGCPQGILAQDLSNSIVNTMGDT